MPEIPPAEFDRYAESYRAAVEKAISFSGRDLDFFTVAKVRTLLELARDGVGSADSLRFLDVGCGPGETDRHLEGLVGGLAGVDISPMVLETARRRNPWVDYRHFAAGEEIPFEAETFDVCFAICVLHHVPPDDREALIAEMRRVCRPGGIVVLFEHNPLNPLTRRAVRGCEFDRGIEIIPLRSAMGLLKQAGLSPAGHRYIIFFTRDSDLLRGVERRLHWLPLGAQYAVFGQRP